jgi:Uma2 family endonuclease
MSIGTLSPKKVFLLQCWQEILNDPELDRYHDDYRIETDADGRIVMSPRPRNPHNRKAFIIAQLLEQRLGGCASTESRIVTDEGVKAADAVWCHPDRWDEINNQDVFVAAPEICVEVLSPGNTSSEIEQKRALYFGAGAREVWICERNNKVSFFGSDGRLKHSLLCPDFPSVLDLSPPQPRV